MKINRLTGCLMLSIVIAIAGCEKVQEPNKWPHLSAPDNLTSISIELPLPQVGFDDMPMFAIEAHIEQAITSFEDVSDPDIQQRNQYINSRLKDVRNFMSTMDRGAYGTGPYYHEFGIAAPIAFTATSDLFGRKAGDNLADLLVLKEEFTPKGNLWVICSYPDFSAKSVAEEGLPLNDYFSPGNIVPIHSLGGRVCFDFSEPVDKESLSGITFTLSIPITYESWANKPWCDKSMGWLGEGKELLPTDRILTASITMP